MARELERRALAGAVVGLARVGVLGAEDDQCRGLVIVDVGGPGGEAVNACEVAAILLLGDPVRELVDDLALLVALGRGAGDLGDRRLSRQPVARPLVVEEGGALGQPAQRVAEQRGRVAGERGAEGDAQVLDAAGRRTRAAVATPRGGRRAEEDGAGDALGGLRAPERGVVAVETGGEAVGAGDVLVDDGLPVVVEVASDLLEDVGVLERERGREDQRALVVARPEQRARR